MRNKRKHSNKSGLKSLNFRVIPIETISKCADSVINSLDLNFDIPLTKSKDPIEVNAYLTKSAHLPRALDDSPFPYTPTFPKNLFSRNKVTFDIVDEPNTYESISKVFSNWMREIKRSEPISDSEWLNKDSYLVKDVTFDVVEPTHTSARSKVISDWLDTIKPFDWSNGSIPDSEWLSAFNRSDISEGTTVKLFRRMLPEDAYPVNSGKSEINPIRYEVTFDYEGEFLNIKDA